VKSGHLLALAIVVVTAGLIAMGTLWPVETASAMAGAAPRTAGDSSSPQGAAQKILQQIRRREWDAAYSALANKGQFSEPEFVRDLTGSYSSLRSYASLEGFDLRPLNASADEVNFRADLNWSSVVGPFQDVRDLKVVKTAGQWRVNWPIDREPSIPPQVIPVNYLRWDVIYRGPQDDWGAQDVESPHVRIVDMHPVDRGGGAVILGELLNEDVVPAFVTVKRHCWQRTDLRLQLKTASTRFRMCSCPNRSRHSGSIFRMRGFQKSTTSGSSPWRLWCQRRRTR